LLLSGWLQAPRCLLDRLLASPEYRRFARNHPAGRRLSFDCQRRQFMSHPIATWVLVADARGARIFSYPEKNGEWTLQETLRGDGSAHPDQTADFGAKASQHKGALHAHGESNPKETKERRFAHLLAHTLARGHQQKAFGKLVLVAPPKLLGDLRENLSRELRSAIVTQLPKDYTHSALKELLAELRPRLQ
jgi:protein required for attachment to host cells